MSWEALCAVDDGVPQEGRRRAEKGKGVTGKGGGGLRNLVRSTWDLAIDFWAYMHL